MKALHIINQFKVKRTKKKIFTDKIRVYVSNAKCVDEIIEFMFCMIEIKR